MLLAKTKDGIEFNVKAHVILSGYRGFSHWEYFIIDLPDENGNGYAFVDGPEQEFGLVCLADVKGVMTSYVGLDKMSADPDSPFYLMPPEGGEWVVN